MEATLSDKRSKVVSSKMVGKAMNSLKVRMFIAASKTRIEAPRLKVKRASSASAGRGSSIMPKTSSTSSGAAVCAIGISI